MLNACYVRETEETDATIAKPFTFQNTEHSALVGCFSFISQQYSMFSLLRKVAETNVVVAVFSVCANLSTHLLYTT